MKLVRGLAQSRSLTKLVASGERLRFSGIVYSFLRIFLYISC